MRVGLFVTCLVDLVAPEVGVATARVLARAGHEVVFPEGQTCCGQPAFNSGYREEAATVLRSTLRALAAADVDAYVAPAGSCTTMVRTFAAGLLDDDPALAAVAPRLYELSEFLAEHGGELRGRVRRCSVAYHDSCHMLRELRLRGEPRAALARVDGVSLADWDEQRCCGFGGTFAVRSPELSVAMADEKLRTLGGADALCGADPSCLMHLRGRLEKLGVKTPVRHLAEILEEGTRP
ncbi:(Fe-S)-binding protein [Solirubrobacter sp. CPCC 204708]|uniref:(Fe-S)-binding protein n=1 Tax=Solirubrobacter deserti TaxID=2282478 RepID=A0ABT4RLA5_9ACTN|nr:(Fe-S)-binding protein [Solirubrobacter deserti]MBE2320463.1 (Fe-S)-binding protein [Solirubrobacter deserti]MDA0139346.1 (Fe-S)-binding protein [Solirubrobacter deserti]